MKLGDWLIQKGKITEDQLSKALRDQAFFGERLGNTLIKLGFVDEDTLGDYLADLSQSRYAKAERLERIPPDVIAAVPGRLAAKYRIVPIAMERRKLHLAMRDPKDLVAIDEVAFLTGLSIEPYVATEFRIVQAIERYYRISLGTKAIPVAGGVKEKPARMATAAASSSPPERSDPQIGLDGLPLDADPGDLDQPFVNATAPPAAHPGHEPLPPSLEAWRTIQEEMPEKLPEQASDPKREPRYPVGVPRAASAASDPAAGPGSETVSIDVISDRLRQVDTRDEVFSAVLDFTTAQFKRAALFLIQQDSVLGWSGRGAGLSPLRIRNVVVPLDRPSLFVFFRSGGDYYYGPVPDLPANAKFYLDLGCPPPARVLLVPLAIKDKPSVILYADNGPDVVFAPDIKQYRRVLAKAALALEILILRNKIMMI